MRRTTLAIIGLLALATSGCEFQQESGPTTAKILDVRGNNPGRFTVASYGTFDAGLHNNTREILIVTDTKTHKQYLAITGCGTTELYTETQGGNPPITTTVEE